MELKKGLIKDGPLFCFVVPFTIDDTDDQVYVFAKNLLGAKIEAVKVVKQSGEYGSPESISINFNEIELDTDLQFCNNNCCHECIGCPEYIANNELRDNVNYGQE